MADIQLKDLPVSTTASDEVVLHNQDGGVDKQITKANFLKENVAELERLAGIQVTHGTDITTNQEDIATNAAGITAVGDALALTNNAVGLNTSAITTKLNISNGVAYDSARLGNVLASAYGLKGTYGSNANGYWVIDGEGNLTQFGQLILTATPTAISFPMNFAAVTPIVTASYIGAGNVIPNVYSQNLSQFTGLLRIMFDGQITTGTIGYIARGRAY